MYKNNGFLSYNHPLDLNSTHKHEFERKRGTQWAKFNPPSSLVSFAQNAPYTVREGGGVSRGKGERTA